MYMISYRYWSDSFWLWFGALSLFCDLCPHSKLLMSLFVVEYLSLLHHVVTLCFLFSIHHQIFRWRICSLPMSLWCRSKEVGIMQVVARCISRITSKSSFATLDWPPPLETKTFDATNTLEKQVYFVYNHLSYNITCYHVPIANSKYWNASLWFWMSIHMCSAYQYLYYDIDACNIYGMLLMNMWWLLICHTAYKAPKVYGKKRIFDARSADIWSLGVVLFMLTVGAPPFSRYVIDKPLMWLMVLYEVIWHRE